MVALCLCQDELDRSAASGAALPPRKFPAVKSQNSNLLLSRFLTHHKSAKVGQMDRVTLEKQTYRYKNAKPAYDRCMGEQMTDFTPIRLHNS